MIQAQINLKKVNLTLQNRHIIQVLKTQVTKDYIIKVLLLDYLITVHKHLYIHLMIEGYKKKLFILNKSNIIKIIILNNYKQMV